MANHWLGVDTGGTFTDFVYYDGCSIRIHKVLSTPGAPEKAILQGIEELQISKQGLQVIHGSTVATNAVLEGKGVNTVYVTNTGFADVLTIGRQARSELYNLMPEPRAALIPQSHCLEVNTRLSASAELLQPLLQDDVDQLIEEIRQIKPSSVAINLLFSFLDGEQEKVLKQAVEDAFASNKGVDMFVCCSSEVLPEYKEYERGMATALNAYVGPLMQGYLNRLSKRLEVDIGDEAANLSVLQSSGGTIKAALAGEHAVHLLLSGPAGGLRGAQYVAGLGGESRLLSFDMGGTSTDVALMDGGIKLSSEGSIAGYPVAVPMVDMHTIGAGGGSVASVDSGGLLNVGPESAGAMPGPACYGNGGEEPTVTDANLILGRLRADGFLGKGMQLDVGAAKTAMQKIAVPLGLSIEEAALGVVRIANEHMVRALREISVQRGYDPEEFILMCFGGAGGLHVCALAKALRMTRAIVPVYGGVLSALGMLVAQPSRELSHSAIQNLKTCEPKYLEEQFTLLEQQGIEDMQDELQGQPQIKRSVDLRYQGQSFTLNIGWNKISNESLSRDEINTLEEKFHELHKNTYGHKLSMPVELVNLRVSIKGEPPGFNLPKIKVKSEHQDNLKSAICFAEDEAVHIYQRELLVKGQVIKGPVLILEKVSTTFVEKGWSFEVDDWGNLILQCEI